MRSSLFAVLVCAACGGAHYLEPNPPQLRHARVEHTTAQFPEPIVWQTILDLYLEPTLDCASAHAWAAAMVRAAMARSDAPWTLELPVIDVSPACDQPGNRTFDPAAVVAQLVAAADAHPTASVRGILVYLNNVDLPAPPSVLGALLQINATTVASHHAGPLLWLVSAPGASRGLSPDRTVTWTWSGDPALPAQLAGLGGRELPLVTDAIDAPVPLAPAADSAPWFKICAETQYARVAGAEAGETYPRASAASMELTTAVPRRFAAMRSGAAPFVTSVDLELCDAHCDRYFDYQPGEPATPWLRTAACAEAAK